MPNVSLTRQMQDYADRQIEAGLYGNLSELMRAGVRKLMEEDGAAAFELLRRDLDRRMAEPTIDVDLRAALLDGLGEEETAA